MSSLTRMIDDCYCPDELQDPGPRLMVLDFGETQGPRLMVLLLCGTQGLRSKAYYSPALLWDPRTKAYDPGLLWGQRPKDRGLWSFSCVGPKAQGLRLIVLFLCGSQGPGLSLMALLFCGIKSPSTEHYGLVCRTSSSVTQAYTGLDLK